MTEALTLTVAGSARIGETPVLPSVELAVTGGAWTCLLGPSGVGKTTLLRLIAGIADEADFEGRIAASDGRSLRGRVALMAQSDLLLPWLSTRENVLLGARLRGERPDRTRADALLDRVGLSSHARKRPDALSGGQRQRAALARTLMEDRPVVLLDEPFSALDAATRAEMQTLAACLLRGRTVLIVTHDPAEAARLGDAIFVLSESGIRAAPVPDSPPPRAVDDPETLRMQGSLMSQLCAAP